MTIAVITPIDSNRHTYIGGRTLADIACMGTAGWWTQRALSDPTLGTWYTAGWGWGGGGASAAIWDGASHDFGGVIGTRTLPPILNLAAQPWPSVGGFLVSAWAVDDAYLGAFSSGVDWNPTAFVIESSLVRCDWCAGYASDVPSSQATTGTWLCIEGTGATRDAPGWWPGVTLFALGEVLHEGTYASALAYRDAL